LFEQKGSLCTKEGMRVKGKSKKKTNGIEPCRKKPGQGTPPNQKKKAKMDIDFAQ